MSKNRIGRINEEIQRELASLIRIMKDPRVSGMVSITEVDTTGDLRWCKVYISVFDKKNEKSVMQGLRSAAGWLRHELGESLNLRYTPELVFEPDDSILRGARITKIINELDIKHGEEEDGNELC